MHSDFSIPNAIESIHVRNGVIALAGYGLDARVDRGRLCLKDGIANHRREASFTKATCGIKRLVFLGHSGAISLEALRWLFDIRAAVFQLDLDGNVILATVPTKLDDAYLRRAQALAMYNDTGLTITKQLLTRKIEGQASVAQILNREDKAGSILATIKLLNEESDMAAVRQREGQAANEYWDLWSDVSLKFVRRDERFVPDYWKRFVQRSSPLTNSQRNAANPGNALLNYLYAILEAETRIAILSIGLDPGLGVLHQDLRSRDSLVYDVMEAVRPEVDRWLLDFITKTQFRLKDFFERRDGTVRLTSPITQMLATSSPIWAGMAAPYVEFVAKQLTKTKSTYGPRALPTHLTQSNRTQGRNRLGNVKRHTAKLIHLAFRRCKECGNAIQRARGVFCSNECHQKYKKQKIQPLFEKAGAARLKELRSKGLDPAHGGEAGRKKGLTNASHAMARKEWEARNGSGAKERDRFVKETFPALKNIPLNKIMKATGLSKRYASLVRQGVYIPHPMHYGKLRALILINNNK